MQRHSMTPAQIDLVRKSFDALWPFRRKLTEQFYGRFFELAPDTRRLFPSDMERQQLNLMDTIAAIVGTLDQRELFQSIISHTGRKHADFGVHGACNSNLVPHLLQRCSRHGLSSMTRSRRNDACRKKQV